MVFYQKKMKTLKPIIEEWQRINSKYCNKNKGKDALYWYNERASLSTLVGAIWLSGGTALEEFSSQKMSNRRKKTGRTDLWFEWQNKKYLIEAKQDSSLSLSSSIILKRIKNILTKEACDDAKKSLPRERLMRIGLVFASPYLHKSKRKELGNKIEDFKTNLEQMCRADKSIFCACSFPNSARDLKYKDYYYPGAVLIGKFV